MAGSLGDLLLVGAGGFAGSVVRYALSGIVHRMVPLAAFPFGSLAVNGLPRSRRSRCGSTAAGSDSS